MNKCVVWCCCCMCHLNERALSNCQAKKVHIFMNKLQLKFRIFRCWEKAVKGNGKNIESCARLKCHRILVQHFKSITAVKIKKKQILIILKHYSTSTIEANKNRKCLNSIQIFFCNTSKRRFEQNKHPIKIQRIDEGRQY